MRQSLINSQLPAPNTAVQMCGVNAHRVGLLIMPSYQAISWYNTTPAFTLGTGLAASSGSTPVWLWRREAGEIVTYAWYGACSISSWLNVMEVIETDMDALRRYLASDPLR